MSALYEEIKDKIGQIRAPKEKTIKTYMKILDLQDELLKDINKDVIGTFAENNFRLTPTDNVPLNTAKDNITLLLLHYILGKRKVKDDLFYLIEEALYTRQIPISQLPPLKGYGNEI
jgi:hypothetical protein